MRWLVTPQGPRIRIKTRFAWLPVQIGDYEVWLERYQCCQVLRAGSDCYYWMDIEDGYWQGRTPASVQELLSTTMTEPHCEQVSKT